MTADANFIYFPDATRRRRHAHKWRDATQAEIEQVKNQEVHIVEGDDDADFFDEFMQNAKPEFMCNLNPTILNALQDRQKIKKKLYIPKNPGVNYIGLLIGPQGLYQKRLEEESDCKILIRGKGSQK